MKQFIALIATAFAVSAFAQTKPAEAPKAKPAVTAPAPAASTPAPAKADVKSEKAGDKKAEAAKK